MEQRVSERVVGGTKSTHKGVAVHPRKIQCVPGTDRSRGIFSEQPV